MGLALAFALGCGWDVGQWHVPKARARILSTVAVRWEGYGTNLYSLAVSQVFLFSVPRCIKKRSLVSVEKLNRWACHSLLSIVLENLSRDTEGHWR